MFILTMLAVIDPSNGDFFGELVETYSDKVFAIAYKTLAKYGQENRSDAEDIVQETFIKIFKNIKRFYDLEREEIIPLLVIYTRNTAIDFLRKRKHKFREIPLYLGEDEEERELEIADGNPLPDELVVRKELIEQCASCIDELPEEQRAVILLKYRYGYKDREIASVLGISESAVSSRLNRARETIRKKMGEYFNE